jgi:hypothetical protein
MLTFLNIMKWVMYLIIKISGVIYDMHLLLLLLLLFFIHLLVTCLKDRQKVKGTPLKFFLQDGTGNNFSRLIFYCM